MLGHGVPDAGKDPMSVKTREQDPREAHRAELGNDRLGQSGAQPAAAVRHLYEPGVPIGLPARVRCRGDWAT